MLRESEVDPPQKFTLPENYTALRDSFQKNSPALSGFKSAELQKVVPDFGEGPGKPPPPTRHLSMDQILSPDITSQGFQPDFLRPVPSPLAIAKEDYMWLAPGPVHDLSWDPLMCKREIINQQLWDKALRDKIKNSEEFQFLEQHLQGMENPIRDAPITTANISELIQMNPQLAYKFLLRIHTEKEFSSYLDPLINQKCTLESFECMHKLLQNMDMPKEFLTFYLTGCIDQIEKLKDAPYGIQTRMARILSTFLRSLIKSKTLNPIDMYIELQAFCIRFMDVQEAASLFKMLKSIDPGNYSSSDK